MKCKQNKNKCLKKNGVKIEIKCKRINLSEEAIGIKYVVFKLEQRIMDKKQNRIITDCCRSIEVERNNCCLENDARNSQSLQKAKISK